MIWNLILTVKKCNSHFGSVLIAFQFLNNEFSLGFNVKRDN